MKTNKIILLITLVIFLLVGCSLGNEKNDYDSLVNTIKNIEISINQLFNLYITFDEYKEAFVDKFIDVDVEKKYLKEDVSVFSVLEKDKKNIRFIKRGELDSGTIQEISGVINKESFSELTEMELSIPYENEKESKKTIYVKNIYEYPICKNRNNGNIKADKVLKKFMFSNINNQWKINSIEETHLESLREIEENGNYEWVTISTIMHEGEEIKYLSAIKKEEEVYVEKELFFNKLSIGERESKLNEIKGKDITIGKLIEVIFPEILTELSDESKDLAYETDYCWNETFHHSILEHIKKDPYTPIDLQLEDICE